MDERARYRRLKRGGESDCAWEESNNEGSKYQYINRCYAFSGRI